MPAMTREKATEALYEGEGGRKLQREETESEVSEETPVQGSVDGAGALEVSENNPAADASDPPRLNDDQAGDGPGGTLSQDLVITLRPIEEIIVGPRLRALDTAIVEDLARSIRVNGLIQPIRVTKSGRLGVGLHRLEAYRLLREPNIPCIEVPDDDDYARLAEIDENLCRAELTVLDQADHLMRREQILDRLRRRAKSGSHALGEGGETVSPLVKTTAALATDAGLGERSAQLRLQTAKNLAEGVKEALRSTKWANATRALVDLARLDMAEQPAVASKLVSGEAETVQAALCLVRGAVDTKGLAAGAVDGNKQPTSDGMQTKADGAPPSPAEVLSSVGAAAALRRVSGPRRSHITAAEFIEKVRSLLRLVAPPERKEAALRLRQFSDTYPATPRRTR